MYRTPYEKTEPYRNKKLHTALYFRPEKVGRHIHASNFKDGQTFMDLPELYTQGSKPVSKNNVLTQEDLKDWPYLEGIKIPSIN